MREGFGNNHTKAFRVARKCKKVRGKEVFVLPIALDWTKEGNHGVKTSSRIPRRSRLSAVTCLVGPSDLQNPILGPNAAPPLDQHRETFHRVNPTKKKGCLRVDRLTTPGIRVTLEPKSGKTNPVGNRADWLGRARELVDAVPPAELSYEGTMRA